MSAFKLRKEKDCLNCGHEVEENFCPHCGQENIEVKEDAFQMVTHAVADYFHFEHKFFKTIHPLLLKPGKLTAAYVAGKRNSFIHPIRLYIFVSILFFLIVLSGKAKQDVISDSSEKHIPSKELTAKQLKKIEKFKVGLINLNITQKQKDSLLSLAVDEIKKTGKTTISPYSGKRSNKTGWFGSFLVKDSTITAYENRQNSLPEKARDGFLKHYIIKKSIELDKYPNPQQKFMEDLMHNVPKMMFLLLPLFAMILKLVYINKNRYYYEHLIYSFHVHAAMFLAILLTMFLSWLTKFVYDLSAWLNFFTIVYLTWYIYRSLRTFYGSTRWVTVLKQLFLFFCYNVLLTICFLIIIAISFAMV